MRYGIFSDVHSNLEAFESVIKALKSEDIDEYICPGDIVGYGTDVSSCIKLAKGLAKNVVAGNHDWASAGLFDTSYFNKYAKAAVLWTAGVLDESEKCYLKSLKLTFEGNDFVVVHGSPVQPEKFHYIMELFSARQAFSVMQKKLCFVGHSHSPLIFTKSGEGVSWTGDAKIKLDKDTSYIVNVGSVGQPRDEDPRACYAVYDTEMSSVEIKRVSYDIKKTQEKILAAGLPPVLAMRLAVGR